MSDLYEKYLSRCDAKLGTREVGGYLKWRGRLVKVLGQDEHAAIREQFDHLNRNYQDSMQRGDTVNDAIVQLLDEKAAELLLDFPQIAVPD
jgi:hypothetical protein